MKTVRISSCLIGVLMLGQWLFFLVTGNVPELETKPFSIFFHIFIETATALILILSAILLRKPVHRVLNLTVFGQGMLAYTSVNSAGYFAQAGQWLFLFMFGAVLACAVLNTILINRFMRTIRQ